MKPNARRDLQTAIRLEHAALGAGLRSVGTLRPDAKWDLLLSSPAGVPLRRFERLPRITVHAIATALEAVAELRRSDPTFAVQDGDVDRREAAS